MSRIRFVANGNEFALTDGEPGPGEVARSQAEAWAAAGVPIEFIEDAPPPAKKGTDKPKKASK